MAAIFSSAPIPADMNEEIKNIIDTACMVFELSKEDLYCSKQSRPVSARAAVYHEIRKAGKVEKWNHYSLPFIGSLFGRDHSTVMYSLKKYQEWRECDPEFRELAERMENELKKVEV